MSEYHYTREEAINENICVVNALVAVYCERNGMRGVSTYRSHEILKFLSSQNLEKSKGLIIIK